MIRACLIAATAILSACATRTVVPPPKVIEIPVAQPVPAACARLRALTLPAGSTAQDVIEAQQRVIVEYEAQVRECSR